MMSPRTKINFEVLQVIDVLEPGGAEKVLVQLSNLLIRNRIEVDVVSIIKEGPLCAELSNGINHHTIGKSSKFHFSAYKDFSKLARKYDLIHVHSRQNLKFVIFSKIMFPFQTKIIFHDHFGEIEYNKKVDPILKFCLRKADYYIGVSNDLIIWAKKNSLIRDGQYSMLRNFLDIHPSGFNTNKGDRILCVSNFRAQKNLEFLIEMAEYCKLRLDLYGQVSETSYLNRILELISSKNLTNVIRINSSTCNIQSVINKYSFAIHTAKSESGPLVLIEYLANGIPFVTYNSGEITQLIKKEFPLFILNSFDHFTWASRIKEVMALSTDPELRQKLVKFYKSNFSGSQYFKECRKIYDKVLIS